MKVVRRLAELPKDWQGTSGFVPTMGAFHEGHLHLMRTAKAENDICIVSIFVNPTQFGANEDYSKYPRNEERDLALASEAGADIVFVPGVGEVYPRKTTQVLVEQVSARWEGEHRPGHFVGVATVVLKLFNMVHPDVSYFGRKDLQQCAVIRRMVDDLNIPIELRFVDTVREADGLAMSSRNAYLSPEHRQIAPTLYRTLGDLASKLRDRAVADEPLNQARDSLAAAGFVVQYLALVDGDTLEPVSHPDENSRIVVAAYLGKTRLIDNVAVW